MPQSPRFRRRIMRQQPAAALKPGIRSYEVRYEDEEGGRDPSQDRPLRVEDGLVNLLGGSVEFERLEVSFGQVLDSFSRARSALLLIRLVQPPTRELIAQVRASGAKILGYPGTRVVLVAATREAAENLGHSEGLADGWGLIPPRLRKVRSLYDRAAVERAAQARGPLGVPPRPVLRAWLVPPGPGDDGVALARVMTLIGERGGVPVRVTPLEVECVLDRAAGEELADMPEVAAVEERELPAPAMDAVVRVLGLSDARKGWGEEISGVRVYPDAPLLDGAGQLVAVADLGLHEGHGEGKEFPDLDGRVAGFSAKTLAPWLLSSATRCVSSDDAADSAAAVIAAITNEDLALLDDAVGHGTHMACVVAGDGSGAEGKAGLAEDRVPRGIAPGARVYVQDIGVWVEWYHGSEGVFQFGPYALPTDLGDLCREAADQGAGVQNFSFFTTYINADLYTAHCREVDAALYERPGLCVCVAAGNADEANEGVTAPGAALNVLTVGACGTDRDGQEIGKDVASIGAVGEAHPGSCRGPTADGRIKPDVVAPGSMVLARRSRGLGAPAAIGTAEDDIQNDAGDPYFPLRGDYSWGGGTSVSAAVASGAVALLRQYLLDHRKAELTAPPSSALLKALVIASAVPLPLGGDPTPNGASGFGRLSLGRLLAPQTVSAWFFLDDPELSLSERELWEAEIAAIDPGEPLIVALVWTDPAVSQPPAVALTNRLALSVEPAEPGGEVLYGNGRPSLTPVVDNAQRVWIETPGPGTWRVKVDGIAVSVGKPDANGAPAQRWALVVLNGRRAGEGPGGDLTD